MNNTRKYLTSKLSKLNKEQFNIYFIGFNYFVGSLCYTNISDNNPFMKFSAAFMISSGLFIISTKKKNINAEYAKSTIYMGSSFIIPNFIDKIIKNYKKYEDY